MAYHIIGLDQGTCAVKAVILERSFRGYEVVGTRMVLVPQDGSAAPSREAVRAAIAQLVEEFDPGSVGYITAAPGSEVSSWFLQLPFADARRIDQTLPFELENYVPFDLEDMVLDYEIVRSSHESSRVVAVLAPRASIAQALQELKSLTIDPEALMHDGFALTYVAPGKEAGERPVAIVDLGHTQTSITVRSGNAPDFMRTIRLGGLSVTRALMKAFGVGYHTAERMKVALGPVDVAPEDLALEASRAQEVLGPPASRGGDPLATVTGAATAPGPTGSPATDGSDTLGRPAAPVGFSSSGARLTELEDTTEEETAAEHTTVLPAVGESRDALERSAWTYSGRTDDDSLDLARALDGPTGEISTFSLSSARGQSSDPALSATVSPVTSDEVQRVVWTAMQPIFREIRGALVAYEGTANQEIGAVLAVGGGAGLEGLCERLSDSLGVPVGRPVRLGPEQVVLEGVPEQARYALPFALAYMGATDARLGDLNFRKGEFRYRKNYEALRGYLLGGAVLVILGLLVLAGMFVQRIGELNAQREQLEQQILDQIKEGFPDIPVETGRGQEKALALMAEQLMKLQERGKALGVGMERRHAIDVLKEISEAMPARGEVVIDLEDFQFEGGQLKLRGTTGTFEDVERIEKALQASPGVEELKNDVSSKGEKKFFTLTVTLRTAEQDTES